MTSRPRDILGVLAVVAVAAATTPASADLLDLLPAGTTDEALRGYVRVPAILDPAPSAVKPLSLAGEPNRLVRVEWTRFEPASAKREGRRVGRLRSDALRLDIVSPFGPADRWRAGWTRVERRDEAFLYTVSRGFSASGEADTDSWALAWRGPSGWLAGVGAGTTRGDWSGARQEMGGQVFSAAAKDDGRTVRIGAGRDRGRFGWTLQWDRAREDLGLAGQRDDEATYAALSHVDSDTLTASVWQRRGASVVFSEVSKTRADGDGPLAASGWQRGAARETAHQREALLGVHRVLGPRRETYAGLQWAQGDADARGFVLAGLLPGLGNRGRGSGHLEGEGLSAKVARRRPLHGPTDLVTGLGVTWLHLRGEYLLEDARGLLGNFEPTQDGWASASLLAAGLTAGLLWETPARRVGVAATLYVGALSSNEVRNFHPAQPPTPPGTPGPPKPATRFDHAFNLGFVWQESF